MVLEKRFSDLKMFSVIWDENPVSPDWKVFKISPDRRELHYDTYQKLYILDNRSPCFYISQGYAYTMSHSARGEINRW